MSGSFFYGEDASDCVFFTIVCHGFRPYNQQPHDGLSVPSQHLARPPAQPQTPPCQEQHPRFSIRVCCGSGVISDAEG